MPSHRGRLRAERTAAIVAAAAFASACDGRDDRAAETVASPVGRVVWSAESDLWTFSSPRAADLNADGVLDVVLGAGFPSDDFGIPPHAKRTDVAGYVTARSGRDGSALWRIETPGEVVGSAIFLDVDADGAQDVVIGGRSATLCAIRGSDGAVLWGFDPYSSPVAQGWFTFTNAQLVGDRDHDGVCDLLVANGGDATRPPFDPERPTGLLLMISGATGAVLASSPVPDGAETYLAPLCCGDPSAADAQVVFGTGGETLPGSLWRAALTSIEAGDLSGDARRIAPPFAGKGMIAPPALVDLDLDGTHDVVAACFGGRLLATSGADDAVLWSHELRGHETYATPAPGRYFDDPAPGVFASFALGVYPNYHGSVHVAVDARGVVRARLQHDQEVVASPLAVDLDGDGRDEALFLLTDASEQVSRLMAWDAERGESQVVELDGRSAATPLVIDLDGDGWLDLVTSTFRVDALTGDVRLRIERRELRAAGDVPLWGSYLGERGDGTYPR